MKHRSAADKIRFVLEGLRGKEGSAAAAQATIATMRITNLQDPQQRRRARLMGSSATITADLGTEVPVDCIALISTTLGAGALVQARLSNVANFSVTLADTGLVNAEAQDESQGNVVLVFPAPVTARYLRVDLTDGAAPYMDIGLLVAGQLWRIQRGRLTVFAKAASCSIGATAILTRARSFLCLRL
jgi:hypothetical protein